MTAAFGLSNVNFIVMPVLPIIIIIIIIYSCDRFHQLHYINNF
jgi:hypothetical protein